MRRYIVYSYGSLFLLDFLTSCSYFMEDKIDEPRPKDPPHPGGYHRQSD